MSCAAYDGRLQSAVDGAVNLLGGWSAFVKPGQRVLLKPNLLTERTPAQAVTTHPELVRCVIRAVRNAGATPMVGDSPASAAKTAAVMDLTGMRAVCAAEDVPLLNLEQSGSRTLTAGRFRFSVATPVLDADAVINLPKVKTHVLTTLTAAVKNMYGILPGYQKASMHRDYPAQRDFGHLVAAIHRAVPPVLNLADGVVGMEGDGPSGGRPVALGFIAAAVDAFALDRILCRILGIDPRAVPTLRDCTGPDPATVGCALATLRPAHFALPSTLAARMAPAWIGRFLKPFIWFRPEIGAGCVACGQCVRACPATALVQDPGQPPRLNPKVCIGCCCCHEICPAHAVRMTQSPLLNLCHRGEMP